MAPREAPQRIVSFDRTRVCDAAAGLLVVLFVIASAIGPAALGTQPCGDSRRWLAGRAVALGAPARRRLAARVGAIPPFTYHFGFASLDGLVTSIRTEWNRYAPVARAMGSGSVGAWCLVAAAGAAIVKLTPGLLRREVGSVSLLGAVSVHIVLTSVHWTRMAAFDDPSYGRFEIYERARRRARPTGR